MAEELPTGVRADAYKVWNDLQSSISLKTSLEEYGSFTATIAAAEDLYKKGELAAADQLFSLAILKGKLLLETTDAAPGQSDTKPAPPAFRPVSTATRAPQPQSLQSAPTPPPSEETNSDEPYQEPRLSVRIVGGKGLYTVRRGDNLRLIASRLGVRLRDLARMNRLKTDSRLMAGQKLKYNNRRIVPKSIRNGIVVNIPDRSLYLFRNGRVSANYPVALGISKKKESTIWRTPVGRFRIVDKQENPTWKIPPSIQKEMEENGEEVLESIPPGPKNPLGKYAMRTSLAGILIHSTTRPTSINSYSSHGCIRVMPEHMELLFKSVSVPMPGEIIYQPVKVEVTQDGRVFLEVNNDSYEKITDMSAEVRKAIIRHHAENMVSWQQVDRVAKEKSGIAEEVTLAGMPDYLSSYGSGLTAGSP